MAPICAEVIARNWLLVSAVTALVDSAAIWAVVRARSLSGSNTASWDAVIEPMALVVMAASCVTLSVANVAALIKASCAPLRRATCKPARLDRALIWPAVSPETCAALSSDQRWAVRLPMAVAGICTSCAVVMA